MKDTEDQKSTLRIKNVTEIKHQLDQCLKLCNADFEFNSGKYENFFITELDMIFNIQAPSEGDSELIK